MPRKNRQHRVNLLYTSLLDYYGPRGWWPLISISSDTDRSGYHVKSYGYPQNEPQQIEICLGALLTQNTNWENASSALLRLWEVTRFDLNSLEQLHVHQLEQIIKPAGYFRQKAIYIVEFLNFIRQKSLVEIEKNSLKEARYALLSIKGIGPETADCMLLYAFRKCSFVVDAYTTRILGYLNIISNQTGYEEVQKIFEDSIPQELSLYQEYHALLVEHGKRFFSKKQYGQNDPILNNQNI